jgi:hypothetical protein
MPRGRSSALASLVVERWILARLRNRRFFSLGELNQAIAELVADLNCRPMRRLGVSRRDLFLELDRPAMKDLPAEPYQYAEWRCAGSGSTTTSISFEAMPGVVTAIAAWMVDPVDRRATYDGIGAA